MNFVYFFCCLGVLTLLLESVNGGSPVYDYSYIQKPCDNTKTRELTLGNGYKRYGYIEADNDGCYEAYPICHIRLSASPGYQITVRFDWINIEQSDELIIEEYSQTHNFDGTVTPLYSYFSTSEWMNLAFIASGDVLNCFFGGFRLYYTSFHHGECADNEFRCALEGRCIPNELKCDRNDNCGDWSDEWSGTCGLSTGAIIGISVTCAVVGIALIAALFYCLYRKSYRRRAEDHSHPPPVNDPHPATFMLSESENARR